MLTYGVAVLARPTFDVPFAEATKERAFAALEAAGIRAVGPRGLLFDRAAAEQAVAEIAAAGPIDLLLILQVTFTDATMTVKLARESKVPLAVWALPEPRIGGRLRLNAYCGLNLAAHALGRAGVWHTGICQSGASLGSIGAADRGAVSILQCHIGQCGRCAGGLRKPDGAVGGYHRRRASDRTRSRLDARRADGQL